MLLLINFLLDFQLFSLLSLLKSASVFESVCVCWPKPIVLALTALHLKLSLSSFTLLRLAFSLSLSHSSLISALASRMVPWLFDPLFDTFRICLIFLLVFFFLINVTTQTRKKLPNIFSLFSPVSHPFALSLCFPLSPRDDALSVGSLCVPFARLFTSLFINITPLLFPIVSLSCFANFELLVRVAATFLFSSDY